MVYDIDRVHITPQSVTLGHESYGRLSCETATAPPIVPVPAPKPRRRSTPATGNLQPSDLVGLTREERRRRRRATQKVFFDDMPLVNEIKFDELTFTV